MAVVGLPNETLPLSSTVSHPKAPPRAAAVPGRFEGARLRRSRPTEPRPPDRLLALPELPLSTLRCRTGLPDRRRRDTPPAFRARLGDLAALGAPQGTRWDRLVVVLHDSDCPAGRPPVPSLGL